jgi:hypothetical protein
MHVSLNHRTTVFLSTFGIANSGRSLRRVCPSVRLFICIEIISPPPHPLRIFVKFYVWGVLQEFVDVFLSWFNILKPSGNFTYDQV